MERGRDNGREGVQGAGEELPAVVPARCYACRLGRDEGARLVRFAGTWSLVVPPVRVAVSAPPPGYQGALAQVVEAGERFLPQRGCRPDGAAEPPDEG